MFTRITFALVMILALAGSHWKAYTSGAKTVQAEWSEANAESARVALAQSESHRAVERALQLKITGISNAYQNQKTAAARAAAGADSRLRQLEDYLDAANHIDPSVDPAAAARADGSARARFVIGQCANALTEMAVYTDAGDAKLTALQEYVTGVLGAVK